MTFPVQPEDLTPTWLSTVLGRQISDLRVEAFGEGAGIIGQVTRVHMQTDSGDQTLIAKFASPSPENRAVADTYQMYAREVGFYQNIANTISLRVPTCYHSDINTANNDFIILMEDMVDMRIGDQVAGCSETEAELVITGIAKLAASTWQTNLDIVSHNNPAQRDGMMAGFGVGWPVVAAQFPQFLPANADELATAIPAAVPWLLEQMCAGPVCVCHADVRLDNVFFSADEIALVDWQSVCSSAPEQDLAYFVTQSLSTEVRNARDWVAVYHDALRANGVQDYSLDQCRERYRYSALYLACYAAIIAGTLDLANERGMALGRTLFGNCMNSLQELNAFDLLPVSKR